MNIGKKIFCRIFQQVFHIAIPFLPYRNPELFGSITQLPEILGKAGIHKPLLVTDSNLSSLGAADGVKAALEGAGIPYTFFDGAYPNPTTQLAEEAFRAYRSAGCDGLIAFGGGSPMDLTKAVGVLNAWPNRPLEKSGGILRVWKRLPPIIAIPTTAGTGSETTLAAVLIDGKTRHKFAINDFPLIPRYAVLDPATIHTLPTSIAASTGLDALTHAVEAYIGKSTTRQTRADAEKAVALVFANLDAAADHTSREAEAAMLQAAHYAGRAFTRSYVGYIHAVSHSLSGKYNLPHGWTNAVLLPLVLKRYGSAVWKPLAKLAVCAGLGQPEEGDQVLCQRFIAAIEAKNEKYGIPAKIPGILEADIPGMARHADREANPLYPVPVLWDARELEAIYREVM